MPKATAATTTSLSSALTNSSCNYRHRYIAIALTTPPLATAYIFRRDVALSLTPLNDSSISNQLQVSINGFNSAPDPAETLVQLTLAGQPLQALLTKQSVERLGLKVGQQVYAQIKAVALD